MTTLADQPLEEQIRLWRGYLQRRQAVHGPDVEELEGHLRDQLAALTEAGLTGDEAFFIAVKRIGFAPTHCATTVTTLHNIISQNASA